jgi:hypothetical protein
LKKLKRVKDTRLIKSRKLLPSKIMSFSKRILNFYRTIMVWKVNSKKFFAKLKS